MLRVFTKHPESVGETYWEHFCFASKFGMSMVMGGAACILHAVFPFLFPKTGSTILMKMAHHFVERMPCVDDKVSALSDTIQKKDQQYKREYSAKASN